MKIGIMDGNENWRRIFRSLIFMDCWLSYTLGYASEVTTDDIAVSPTASISELELNVTGRLQIVSYRHYDC
jgi:hypothetical protein